MKKSETTTLTRESETREKQKRKTDWTPPSSLDAPPVPKGLVQRWIRAETMGFMDLLRFCRTLVVLPHLLYDWLHHGYVIGSS